MNGWKPPAPESITVHPGERQYLDEQLPTARVYGEPLPDGMPIVEDLDIVPGTIRLRIDGRDVTVTLGRMPEPRWVRCDPMGPPFSALVP